jgi:hypothetical protein
MTRVMCPFKYKNPRDCVGNPPNSCVLLKSEGAISCEGTTENLLDDCDGGGLRYEDETKLLIYLSEDENTQTALFVIT